MENNIDVMSDRSVGKLVFLVLNTVFTLWALISFFNIKGLFAAVVGFYLLWRTLFKEENVNKNAGQFLYLFVFVDLLVLTINQIDVIRTFYSEDIAKIVFDVFTNNISLFIVGFALVICFRSCSLGRLLSFSGVELINYVFAISIGGNGNPFEPEFQAIGWAFFILSTIMTSIWYISLSISIKCGKKDGMLLYEILYFVGLALIFNMNFGYIINLLCEFNDIINYLTVSIYSFWRFIVILAIFIVTTAFLGFGYSCYLEYGVNYDRTFLTNTTLEMMVLYFIGEMYFILNYAFQNYFPYQWILVCLYVVYCLCVIGKVHKDKVLLLELKDNSTGWSNTNPLCWSKTMLGYIVAPFVTIFCMYFISKGYYLSIAVCLFYFLRYIKIKDSLSLKSKKIWYEVCIFITLLSISYIVYLGLYVEKIVVALIICLVIFVTYKVLDTKIWIDYEEPKYIKIVLILCACLLSFMNVNKDNKTIHTEYNDETKKLTLVTNLDEEEFKNIEIKYYFSNRKMMKETEPKQYKKGEIELEDEIITLDITDENGVTSRFVGYYPRELEKIKTTMSKTKYDSAMKKVKKNIEDYTKIIEENKNKEIPKKGK